MIHIIGKPCLQAAQGVVAQCAATIHELFVNARHLGDVRVCGDKISVWQKKANVCVRLPSQIVFQLCEFHNIQKFILIIHHKVVAAVGFILIKGLCL